MKQWKDLEKARSLSPRQARALQHEKKRKSRKNATSINLLDLLIKQELKEESMGLVLPSLTSNLSSPHASAVGAQKISMNNPFLKFVKMRKKDEGITRKLFLDRVAQENCNSTHNKKKKKHSKLHTK